MSILLKTELKSFSSEIKLPLSKSIANRLLMLKALCGVQLDLKAKNVPNDISLFQDVLFSSNQNINVQDAGTAMRFATAFYSLRPGIHLLEGSHRMHQRPIEPLVQALNSWGAKIKYLNEDAYPPLEIKGGPLRGGTVKIDGGISSQFISALLMIAPFCAEPCTLILEGTIASLPYLHMTIKMMHLFGVEVTQNDNVFEIQPGSYTDVELEVERDWSSASFYYLLCALSQKSAFDFPGLSKNSIQGDCVLAEIFNSFGVVTKSKDHGLQIQKTNSITLVKRTFDFSDHPDLFIPVVTACAGLGVDIEMTGLINLHLKESDRLEAMIYNLKQINATLLIDGSKGALINAKLPKKACFKSFDDHRIAMSMAMLAVVLEEVEIDQQEVVSKSFPGFWEELKKVGFVVESK